MNIACLGWGSLIWRPGSLLIRRQWFLDGPLLPIEYARQSNDGRLTLVITETAMPVRTLWALMATDDLLQAKKSLRTREEIPESKMDLFIASVKSNEETTDRIKLIIQSWAISLKLDAVIWTSLPPKFNGTLDRVPTIEESINYLNSLDVNSRKNAEEYIRKAPKQIDTNYRRKFEAILGWANIE